MSLIRAWESYRNRKTRVGIVLDFLILVAVVVLLVPSLRMGVMVNVIRITLRQPQRYIEQTKMLIPSWLVFSDSDGRGVTLPDTLSRPILINFAATWSPQSRAEMKSLNLFEKIYGDYVDLYVVFSEERDEVERYIEKRKYNFRRLYLENEDVFEIGDRGLTMDLINSIPSSVLLDKDGSIIVKKFGAARWTGKRVNLLLEPLIEKP